jgi:hypothetical protein
VEHGAQERARRRLRQGVPELSAPPANGDAPDLPAGVDLLALVRRYEPVVRYTAGEMFFPMPAADYLARASLWLAQPDGRAAATLLVDHGDLDPGRLAAAAREHPHGRLFVRYAPSRLRRRELRAWRRRPDRPRFHGVSRLAAVGLLGRFIDLGMRLSLTLRGRVPGGLTAAAQQQYAATETTYAYHAHVSTDGGYVVIQYWFLYAMNDWRSSFSGVNDHEADWEQVTVYLAADGLALAWVDGTHPVVNAGAGSHSGACLAGDYLVRVQPPALERLFAMLTGIRSALFPWTRGRPSLGVGIPYVDYRRGDGVRIGAGTDRPWTTVLIDSDTPWVRDFRGLWGLDTDDPFGGERAPAGPRYERTGAIRASWADPVGWAGLDKVPPTRRAGAAADAARVDELDALVAALDADIAAGQGRLRRAAAGAATLPAGGENVELVTGEREVAELRARRRAAVGERDRLRHASPVPPPPHAHLRHRAVPETAAPPGAIVRFWSGASLSVLLLLLGVALLLDMGSVPEVIILAVLLVMGIEALLRRRLILFVLGLAIVVGIVVLVWLLFTHLRVAFGVLAIAAAVALAVANVRNVVTRR